MKEYDAVIAGYTCVDMIPVFPKIGNSASISDLFTPGKLIEIENMNFVLGGAVPNTGLAMKKFGRNVFLNGLIGNDMISKIAREWLNQYGISEGIATTSASGTAFSIVLAPPGIDRIFLESPGCNKIFDSTFINYDVVSRSKIFHFGYPPLLRQFYLNNGFEMVKMFRKVQELGAVTSLDFSLPDTESESGKVNWPEVMKATLPFTDIFVPSLEEVLQIMMPGKYNEIRSAASGEDIIKDIPVELIRELGSMIISSGVKILMIKAGERGAYLKTGNMSGLDKKLECTLKDEEWNNKEFWCTAYHADKAKIKSASGAGDTANAAFLSAIIDGNSPEVAVKYAALAGRNNLYCLNLYSDLESWSAMSKEIHSVENSPVYM
jgi:sugar/nucleoside kinase (ribokinase family)